MVSDHDPVNNPSHYTQGKIECIDAIEAALGQEGFLAFLRGQVIKYTWRAKLKGQEVEDSGKAKWYQDKMVLKLSEYEQATKNLREAQTVKLNEKKEVQDAARKPNSSCRYYHPLSGGCRRHGNCLCSDDGVCRFPNIPQP